MSWGAAQRRYERAAAEDANAFFFDLDDGRVSDRAQGGNSARWVNHSCEPKCEAERAPSGRGALVGAAV
ncbi:SET domain-containing protein-lysine N-methyltransferase [Caballeronia glebae]|uniref:SET domain-containing protein-lysine N-methyltransferase n=1 Tax=Caballeronia glebae TaxID=1777143 RepID=UPI002E135E7D|nr:SET domain-containing protein-lysine N-methyltransferase [Caballeronia glebae]